MPSRKIISMRVSDDWHSIIRKAADKLGYVKGDSDKGVSHFIRQACTEKANKVLGLPKTLPVLPADYDEKTNIKESKMSEKDYEPRNRYRLQGIRWQTPVPRLSVQGW